MATTKQLAEVYVDEEVILIDLDARSAQIAKLRKGGSAGGAQFDLYFAFVRDTRPGDAERYPAVVTYAEEAERLGIAL